jgi:hypothetical protein
MNEFIHYAYFGGKMSVKDIKHFLSKSYDKNLNDHGDYKIDKSLSGKRAQVYHDERKNHTVVVHKGTDSLNDWVTDLRLGLGDRSGTRFKHAKDVQRKAEQKYANSNISTLGHSLGSKLAEEASQNPDNEIITLNNPIVLSDLIKKPKSNQYNIIRTSLDPVSILRNVAPSKSKNDLTIKSTTGNILTEHNTDTLNRINQDMEIGKGIKGAGSGNVAVYSIPQILQELNYEHQTAENILHFFRQLPFQQQQQVYHQFTDRYHELKSLEERGKGMGTPISYQTYKQFAKKYKISTQASKILSIMFINLVVLKLLLSYSNTN